MLGREEMGNGEIQIKKSLNKNKEINASVHSSAEDNALAEMAHVDNVQNQQQRQQPATLNQVEGLINKVLSDNKKMARFGKVIAAASFYGQARTLQDKIDCLTSIRESAANYLRERKNSSDPERKTLCERLILSIDSYAGAENIEIGHSTAFMLDGRYMTNEEIDNEIRLAHSLTGAEPLTEITKERRDAFKKKLEDVKTANTYLADINKWKTEKSSFLADKKDELEIGQGVNKDYDAKLVDVVSWYGRAYNRKDEAMTTMLGRLTIGDDKGQHAINIKARQIELILADIMSWNMDDFSFSRTDDFLHRKDKGETQNEHFLRLYSKLQVAKNAEYLLGELMRMKDSKNYTSPYDFSEKTLDEIQDRLKIYKEIEKDYSERLSIMSSSYYALLQESDIQQAMTDKSDDKLLALKQEKAIAGTQMKKKIPAEFADYIDKLHAKKKRWNETKINDYFTRNTRIERSIDDMLEGKGMTVNERKTRFNTERQQLENLFTRDLTAFKQEQIAGFKTELKEAIEKESPEVERQNIDASMREVQDRGFIPVERPASRMGLWGTLKTYGLAGARWMVGATIGKIGTAVGFVLGARKQLQEKGKVATAQKKRIHGIVPGTKDERFDDERDERVKGSDEDTEILYDFRRAPLIWEKLSAGDPEDPPEVTIMSKQSIEGSRAVDHAEMGHAMIGLSYSRYNKATKRKERYNLKIGFYPGGGATKFANNIMMGANALMHGQIMNDSKTAYNIARRYTVTPGAINRILLAAETYADGGYGYYTRNCATFVADMAKLADIPLGDAGVNEVLDTRGFSTHLEEIGVGGANSAYYVAANNIADKFQTEDKSYQNYGQKLTTKEDLDRYYDSTKNKEEFVTKGASPGALGEDLREAKDNGNLTALDKELNKEFDKYEGYDEEQLQWLSERLETDIIDNGIRLAGKIIEKLEAQNLPTDEISLKLASIKNPVILSEVVFKQSKEIPGLVKALHKKITDNMKLVNDVYKNTLKNDSELNKYVMDYLGTCEATLNFVDRAYQDNIKYEYTGQTAGLLEDYDTDRKLIYKENGKNIVRELSPMEYYGFVKMGKSGEKIVKDLDELAELKAANQNGQLTSEQARRLDALERERETAFSFGRANCIRMSFHKKILKMLLQPFLSRK